jgi:hypothetical protein
MYSKTTKAFSFAGSALALMLTAGIAQAAEDITVEQTLKKNSESLYEFKGTFPTPTPTSNNEAGYTFGVEIKGNCESAWTEDLDVGRLDITANEYTLTLVDSAEIQLALTDFDARTPYPLPAFTYCATPNVEQGADATAEKAQMTWNLLIPGQPSDVVKISVAKNAGSDQLIVELYNAHSYIEATSIDLVVDMGPLACSTPPAIIKDSKGVNVPTTNRECGSFTVGTGADEVTIANGLKITSELTEEQTFTGGDVLNYGVNYTQDSPSTDKWDFKVYAFADYNVGVAKNEIIGSAKVTPGYTRAVNVDNASETSVACDSSISDCLEGFSGEDIAVWFGNDQVLSAGSSISLKIDSKTHKFNCPGRHAVVTDGVRMRLDTDIANKVECFDKKITVTLANELAAYAKIHLDTIEEECTSSACPIDYSLFLHDADTDSRVNLVKYFYSYRDGEEDEDDSLTAVIAFISLLMAIWYFRREKVLKAS